MALNYQIIPHTLLFKRPAATSRGVYDTHRVWYVVLRDEAAPSHCGVGECAPLPGLSCDFPGVTSRRGQEDLSPDVAYERQLDAFCRQLVATRRVDTEALRDYPSILFGLETAMMHFHRRSLDFYPTDFTRGVRGIPINGLIWMGDPAFMSAQIAEKLRDGFRCVKPKIGSLDFDREYELLHAIRRQAVGRSVAVRVDANGAFDVAGALDKLNRLAPLALHSVEQPIRAGQWQAMARLAELSPVPVALDEELIGVNHPLRKAELLDTIRPAYIVLKPSLHGGISGCEEWIRLADARRIGWWITSALESNVGLNAIAQWCATLDNPLPQGLGTGGLYTNNVAMPLVVRGDLLWFVPSPGNTVCIPSGHVSE